MTDLEVSMDVPAVRARVAAFAELIETSSRQSQGGGKYWESAEYRQIEAQRPIMKTLFDAVDPRIMNEVRSTAVVGGIWPFGAWQTAVHQAMAILDEREELAAMLEPSGPALAAAGLHPWIWSVAAQFWDDGYYRAAVHHAGEALQGHLQAKLGRNDITGTALVQRAYSANSPGPGEPRLRPDGITEGTAEWGQLVDGVRALGQGAFQFVRNAAAHGTGEWDPDYALEALAVLSLFARRVDKDLVAT